MIKGGLSQKSASARYNIPQNALRRNVKNVKTKIIYCEYPILEGSPRLTPNYRVNQFFSVAKADIISDYLRTMTKHHHGLNHKNARQLALSWTNNCSLVVL